MGKHTEGKWVVEYGRFCDRITLQDDKEVTIANTGNWLAHEKPEQRANAELISAAPDLLQALEAARAMIDVSNIRTSATVLAKWEAVCQVIDAALSRARGQ